uniref:Endonuclease/exonuclease/phosphatase domain-containing protein n=1 Tax=Setaria digitata TaxID=48799 RepID=A0A915PRV7_9BILA
MNFDELNQTRYPPFLLQNVKSFVRHSRIFAARKRFGKGIIVKGYAREFMIDLLKNNKNINENFSVPKEKIEIVVDDTPEEMTSETVQNVLDVQKQSGEIKAHKEMNVTDLDVIEITDDESSSSKQANLGEKEPEIVLLGGISQNKIEESNDSEEIICLEDFRVSDGAGPSSSVSPILQQKTMERFKNEVRDSTNRFAHHKRQSRFCGTNLTVVHPVHSTLSSSSPVHAANMPEFVDLLTQGTLMICRKWLRRWDVLQNGVMEGIPLRICSYNILCQQTTTKTPELYTHLAKPGRTYELTWENRWRLLAREFAMIGADIFCLQEVQYDHYDEFFKPYFEAAGFLGKYKKRTHGLTDGCAIFYKTHFQLLHYRHIEYYLNVDSVLNRDNVGQLARLKDIRCGRDLCIANTHLLFNKRRGDVKLAQLAILLANIDKECGPGSGQECPYILCGDFNIQPHSPLYNFIMRGEICFTNLRRGDISGQGSPGGPFVSVDMLPVDAKIAHRAMLLPPGNYWSHPLCFNSVYQHMNAKSGQSVFPISDSAIRISEKGLRLIRRLTLPNVNQLAGTLGPWPNSTTPSDHIPLIADFILQ